MFPVVFDKSRQLRAQLRNYPQQYFLRTIKKMCDVTDIDIEIRI